ncbi:hypothetical protein [Arthrobacter cavernae]|uniref:hypothetical protein n=1 Tax=Arthrobacter cavernae TaxID=2817681 RepID=UPI001F6153D2|nr:hypothetical protein [Arthrobacter cavernae]
MNVPAGEGPAVDALPEASMQGEEGSGTQPEAVPAKDAWLPRWLIRHPLYAGWVWTGFWAGLIVLDEFVDLAGWTWYVLVGMAALPTLVSTLAVLKATPRRHLKPQQESVLAHFFVRFLALLAAFLVWGFSVVASASISSTVQVLAGDSEREVTSLGLNLLLAAVPLVFSVLWLAFIVRCAWFLRRLRGWSQSPANSRVPKKFLRGRPGLRRLVVGLAHPGLLLVAGLGTSVLALLLASVELTIDVLR